jgi:hypothetical protein
MTTPTLRPVVVNLERAATEAAAFWGDACHTWIAQFRRAIRDDAPADRVDDCAARAYNAARAAGTAARLAR